MTLKVTGDSFLSKREKFREFALSGDTCYEKLFSFTLDEFLFPVTILPEKPPLHAVFHFFT